ncbi:MAG: MOFRL family protein, partial [Longimicrobiales bacterium]
AGTPERVRRHLERGDAGDYLETPKPGDALFANVSAQVIGNNGLARAGAAEHARALGYDVVMLDEPIVGEARDAGATFVRTALELRARSNAPRVAVIAGGETTVTVRGNGRGGRNQELALAGAIELAGTSDILVASFGTDGIDGPTSVAGAVADGESVARAGERSVDAHGSLADNDAFGFFGCLHDLLLTGPTGTNVLDVQIALVGVTRLTDE